MKPKLTRERKPVIEKPISKKLKKKKYDNYGTYLFRLMKTINEPCGISKQSILVLNNLVSDLLENIAREAGNLVNIEKKKTLSARDIQAAVGLIMPGELRNHAMAQGKKAVSLYFVNLKEENL
ncbi:unnamed protein product [Leptidea sinapis]|uniref:Core Histone H2A/H2B/H3 domain-containing protein n=1 Tax=Leptidea sinapis TaxID=189913 RepID=A0A5E4PY10_9NEOP|nr:unnamed protein product [Leptidea sinapis]